MSRFDIIVAGAGPVGLATAALLAASPVAGQLRVRVLDGAARVRRDAGDTDLRVYALSRSAENVLLEAGALPGMRAERMSPYRTMQVWEGATLRTAGRLCFDSAEIGEPNLGHIVEDNLIRAALSAVLESHPAVELMFERRLESVELREREVRVSLHGESRPLSAAVLIGADGGRSQVREAAALPGIERDYGQMAIVAHVASERDHAQTAWQRFLPGGPLALLPLLDGRSSIVWSLPAGAAQELVAAPPAQFERRLTLASGQVLGRLTLESNRHALPLLARHVWRYCRPRLALAGDAAHSVHPLAGQGVNLGLADAAELAGQIAAAVTAGQDPGDLRILQRYARARIGHNMLMLGALDGLDRLFRAPRLLAPLRMTGLSLVDRVPLLKRRLIRHAAGEMRSSA